MPTSLILIELGALVVALAVLARLSGRVGFSPIPLYLLGGLAFGEGGLVPLVTAEQFIELGAEIGVIMLLFMLGLEYSGEELMGTLRARGPDGAMDLVLNFLPGLAAGLVLGWDLISAALLGGVTYISSSGVIAKVISDLGWVGNRETPTVLSLLVIEDLAMAIYLPLLAALLVGQTGLQGAISVVVALAAAGTILLVAVRFGGPLSRLVFSRSDEVLLLSIFGLTLLVSGVAERLQVSAAVGAFLIGIGVSGPAADRARSLLGPLRDLFGAVFFVFFGLRIDPASILPVVLPALALAAAGAATKLVTGWVSARRVGVGPRGRWRAGAVLVARGEFSIAIAALGIGGGADPRLAPVTAAFVLMLALVGPVAARLVDPAHAQMVET